MRKASKQRRGSESGNARNRVIIEFPPELLSEADAVASECHSTRSDVVRAAVRQYVNQLKRAKFEAELAEGYRANAELDRKLSHEFRFVDAEGRDA
jgi:metal-responsive CopG/Arc/MetJ family transcriptional regulator